MRASSVAVSLLAASFAGALLASACRTTEGDTIPRSLPGVYEYDAAGRAFGHPWSFHVALELRRDGGYEMITESDIDGERDRDTDSGRYIVRDGIVYLSKGGSDRVIVAYARIGQILWDQACPVRLVDGSCVKVVRERAVGSKATRRARASGTKTQCGPPTKMKVTVVKRDPRALGEDA